MNEQSSAGVDDPDSWAVPDLLIRFVRATHELNRCEPRHEAGLSAQQIRALVHLVHHDGRTIKDLAQALSLSEARASRLAEELVESGHILTERDVADRRQVLLHVTPAASEKAQRIYRQRAGALEAALAGASPREIKIFTRLLGRVVEEFEELSRVNAASQPAFSAVYSGTSQEIPPAQAD